MKIMESNTTHRKRIPAMIVLVVVGILHAGGAQAAKPSSDIVTIDICPSSRAHFRNDWSLVFPLKQGRLMLVWCEYYATSPEQVINRRKSNYTDPAACRISAKISTDKGRTWSDTFTLQENTARLNVKHPNLLRLSSDPNKILMFFTSRRVDGGKGGDIRIFMKQSTNECESWSKPVQISTLGGTHFLMADRVLQLPGGRILLPTFQSDAWFPFDAFCYYSDDAGRTWRASKTRMTLRGHGAQEPSIVRLENGKLLAVLRTSLGAVYKSYSDDKGTTWTKPVSTGLAAPASTPLLKRIPGSGDLLLVWNNIFDPKHPDFQNGHGPRNPLTSAISSDDGRTWRNIKTIEDRNPGASSTPAVTFVGKKALLTYNTQPFALAKRELYSVRLKIIPIDWFRRK
ncbi:MAG: hypothetical protein CMJ69_08250 [Planctomycetaceae bacterium]|nr:hypothetical protein [Planctomycetaceae bacterium]